MRSQAGTGDLRALIYMDEVFGFVPPTAAPPAKRPILTILKQARAFGIGMLLSTQNPVDLDYKAMSNAGTWCIGRLQTERDKMRILEALQAASGDIDVDELDRIVSALEKRSFLLHNTREKAPSIFTTRWAMSYLRGPLTRDELSRLTGDDPRRSAATPPPPTRDVPDDATTVAPAVASGVKVGYLDPAAPWAEAVGANRAGTKYRAALAATVHMTFDDHHAGVDHDEVWEAIVAPLESTIDPATAIPVDHDPRDFLAAPPGEASYELTEAPIDSKKWFGGAKTAIRDHLHRKRSIEVFRNRSLKAYSRVGETREDFARRCVELADAKADDAVASLRDRFENRIRRARDQIDTAMEKVRDAELDVESRRQEELVSGAGTVIGVLLGRKSTRSMSTAATKRSRTRKAEHRLESVRERVTDEVEDLEELEADLADAVAEISAEWEDKAADIETVEIGLEKSDVSVEDLILVWIPTA